VKNKKVICTAFIIIIMIVLLQFRCEPLSQQAGQTFFQRNGDGVADMLLSIPSHLSLEMSAGSSSIIVDAQVDIASRASIPIFYASSASGIQKFTESMKTLIQSPSASVYPESWYGFFEIKSYESTAQNGWYKALENGYIDSEFVADFHGDLFRKLYVENDAAYWLREMDIIAEKTYVPNENFNKMTKDDGSIVWSVDTCDVPLPVSPYIVSDTRRMIDSPKGTLDVSVYPDGYISIHGVCLKKDSVAWDSTYVCSISEALDAIVLQQKNIHNDRIKINKITLMYQPQYVRGNPQKLLLSPIWVFDCSEPENSFIIVNAVETEVYLDNASIFYPSAI
jgi:hypothetical protein